LYIEKPAAMRTASWTSPSVAPASCAACTSSAVSASGSPRTVRAMCSRACIFGSKPSDEPCRTSSSSGASSVVPCRCITAVAKALCESMQKKQSFAAETAAASVSR
jgi:hypothetical protein